MLVARNNALRTYDKSLIVLVAAILLTALMFALVPDALPYHLLTLALLTACSAGALLPQRRVAWLVVAPSGEAPKIGHVLKREYGWCLAALALTAAALIVLERQSPYYFFHDDNYTQYTPVLLTALRQFFETGIFPVWNGYLDFGMPIINGGYALTYPSTWLAYPIALLLDGGQRLMDVMGWMHMLAGTLTGYLALRVLGVRPMLAAAGAPACIFIVFNLTHGRSWQTVLYLPFLLSALGLSLAYLLRTGMATRRWALWTGMLLASFFQISHFQFWLYGMFMWFVPACWCMAFARERGGALRAICIALLIGAAFSLPLFIPQYLMAQEVPPAQWIGDSEPDLACYLLPQLGGALLNNCRHAMELSNPLAAIALLWAAAALTALLRSPFPRDMENTMALRMLSLPLVAALLAAPMLGEETPVWKALATLPVLEQMTYPTKLLPFAYLPAAICGLWALELAFRAMERRCGMRTAQGISALAALALAASLSAVVQHSDWSRYPMAQRPYRPLPAMFQPYLFTEASSERACRSWSIAYDRSLLPDFPWSLSNNFPSHYGILSANRYPQRVMTMPESRIPTDLAHTDPVSFARAYGICLLVMTARPDSQRNLFGYYPERIDLSRFSRALLRLQRDSYTAYDIRDQHTAPLAWLEIEQRRKRLPHRLLADGVEVFGLPPHRGRSGMLTANYLYRPWMHAYDERGQELALQADDYGRMQVILPPDTASVRFRYQPPWHMGMVAGFGLLCLAGWLLRRPTVSGVLESAKKSVHMKVESTAVRPQTEQAPPQAIRWQARVHPPRLPGRQAMRRRKVS